MSWERAQLRTRGRASAIFERVTPPAASSHDERAGLGLASGVGLVASSMVGVGVLVSAGWASRVLGPGEILLAWIVGGVLAMCGARAYAALAELIPRSGGEYRYLADLLHPAVGYMAGWASLVLGFAAPVAFCAATADAYAATLVTLPQHVVGVTVITTVTAVTMGSLRTSRRMQDVLALAKLALFAGFLLVGLFYGSSDWPQWRPEVQSAGFPLGDFLGQLLWVAFAYSGWNTAAYAAEAFREPRRDVPRAMVIGAVLVMALYLVVNWIFVANLDQAELASWRGAGGDQNRTTLGHLIVLDLIGPVGAAAMSGFVVLSMLSSTSAFTIAGPFVYAAMARDGLLPRVLAGVDGAPPKASILLQSSIALALLLTHSFDLLVENVGAVLTFTTALTALCVLRARFAPPPSLAGQRIAPAAVACAIAYFAMSAYTLWEAASARPARLLWIGAMVAVTALGYVFARPKP
jgi:APA family basic amino acid/polyamine antiporter